MLITWYGVQHTKKTNTMIIVIFNVLIFAFPRNGKLDLVMLSAVTEN